MSIFRKLFKELPLDYQLGYQDGFNGAIKVMQDTLKHIGKLDVKNVQKRHKLDKEHGKE